MSIHHKTEADTVAFADAVAARQGWKLNPDLEFRSTILHGLTTNYNRYGFFMCPCRDSDGVRGKDRDIMCPCDYVWPDVQEFGHCYCGLFLGPDFTAAGKQPGSIPERRPPEKW